MITDRSDAVLRDPSPAFGLLVALLAVLVPAALLLARSERRSTRRDSRRRRGVRGAALAIGYPVQRDYLRDRFAAGQRNPRHAPRLRLRWARDVSDARIGLAGTTAGFLQYGFYGTDLSNEVRLPRRRGAAWRLQRDPRPVAAFRAAVNAAELDYLVTAPFLNFIHPDQPIRSPEAGWLRGEPAVTPIERSGPVTVWRVRGRLDPEGCGPANAPLREIPDQPRS